MNGQLQRIQQFRFDDTMKSFKNCCCCCRARTTTTKPFFLLGICWGTLFLSCFCLPTVISFSTCRFTSTLLVPPSSSSSSSFFKSTTTIHGGGTFYRIRTSSREDDSDCRLSSPRSNNKKKRFATKNPSLESSSSSPSNASSQETNDKNRKLNSSSNNKNNNKKDTSTHFVTTVSQLNEYFQDPPSKFRTSKGDIDYDTLLSQLIVHGDTSPLGATQGPYQNFTHPVLQLLHQRRNTQSPLTPTSQQRPDGRKVALIIEGGGMRGCVTAGMVCAIHYLGLEDAFDVIYGSSAGTVIGAYFCTRQLPWFGPEIYYDSLTTAKKRFIDSSRFMRTLGVGLLDPRLIKDVITRPAHGKPVLNLDFLLKETVQVRKPLDWVKFVKMQEVQPVRVVASGLRRERSVTLDMANGGFRSLDEFACAAHASCLLPGIAGPVMNYDSHAGNENDEDDDNENVQTNHKYFVKNGVNRPGVEPLADALIFEPLPYRTALEEGATDVVVLRSRPDGTDVTGKTSLFEKLIFWRFFQKKNRLDRIYKYMRTHQQKKLYAELVLELNEATKGKGDKSMMAIAVPAGSPEITRLETRREAIFDGVRRGFARAYDALVEDKNERGRGMEVAKQVLPDEILNYDPLEIDSGNVSAFEYYLKQKRENGEPLLDLPEITGKTAAQAGLPR